MVIRSRSGWSERRREARDQSVDEREHLVARRFHEPDVSEPRQHIGVGVGDIRGLGEVVGEVEQAPLIGVEVAASLEQALFVDDALRHVVGRRLPVVVHDRP